jgi:hypothetical protein
MAVIRGFSRTYVTVMRNGAGKISNRQARSKESAADVSAVTAPVAPLLISLSLPGKEFG